MILSSIPLLALSGLALGSPAMPPLSAADTACIIQNPGYTNRTSPLDSVSVQLGGHTVKFCYGRPSARGRTMIGGTAVPYGKLWRTGANEPTMLHTEVALTVAGIAVEPGVYSFYTVPGKTEWEIIINRSTSQWGRENRYTAEVQAQEVGRGRAQSERMEDHVEMFTIQAESGTSEATVLLEWEHTRVRVPIVVASSR